MKYLWQVNSYCKIMASSCKKYLTGWFWFLFILFFPGGKKTKETGK